MVELSLSGQTLGTMAFDGSGTGSSNNDAEGLTSLGGGRLVVVDERPQMAYRFSYAAGGSVALNAQPEVAITGSSASVGNVGTEGISVDSRSGSCYSVRQDNPAQLRVNTLSFAVGGGTAATTVLHTGQAIAGVTVDSLGNIHLVAGDSGTTNSRLFVLSAPVPEPGTCALLLAGLAGIGLLKCRGAVSGTH